MSSPFRHLYEFGPFRLDATERVLLRDGGTVRLTPKEFDTLLALVRGGGRVMSKEELLKEIWPDTFVGEATLAQNVFTLRRALGEAEGGAPFIETVPRRGYRFAVKVTERREGDGADRINEEPTRLFAVEGVEGDRAVAAGRVAAAAGPPPGGPQHAPADSAAEDPSARRPAAGARAAAEDNGHVSTAPPSTSAHSPAPHATAAGGHPARAAVLIAAAVFVSVAALVYAVYRLSVRPEAERA
ncbi:MAG TPA: transcriptional regulator, partial [Pyrinomonadaceae bacterium]